MLVQGNGREKERERGIREGQGKGKGCSALKDVKWMLLKEVVGVGGN